MFRSVVVLGCLGVLSLSGGWLSAEDRSGAESVDKIDKDPQLVYNVEGLT
jgi:hypothetical protein